MQGKRHATKNNRRPSQGSRHAMENKLHDAKNKRHGLNEEANNGEFLEKAKKNS